MNLEVKRGQICVCNVSIFAVMCCDERERYFKPENEWILLFKQVTVLFDFYEFCCSYLQLKQLAALQNLRVRFGVIISHTRMIWGRIREKKISGKIRENRADEPALFKPEYLFHDLSFQGDSFCYTFLSQQRVTFLLEVSEENHSKAAKILVQITRFSALGIRSSSPQQRGVPRILNLAIHRYLARLKTLKGVVDNLT